MFLRHLYDKLPMFEGIQVMVYSFLIDLTLQILLRLAHRIGKSKEIDELKRLNKELQDVDKKEEFARYAKINRRRKALDRSISTGFNPKINYVRVYLPCIIFVRCYLFEVPSHVFSPFNRLLYIEGASQDGFIKIGFPFIWIIVTHWVDFICNIRNNSAAKRTFKLF